MLAIVLLDGDSLFVTSADQLFYWGTIAYILVYLAMHAVNRNHQEGHEVPVYNVIVATLQLTACRFYASAETPYNLVLIGILACRGWCVWWGLFFW